MAIATVTDPVSFEPKNFPSQEPYVFVSDVGLDEEGSSNSNLSYSVEYSALGDRNGIRHLMSDSFKIEVNRNYSPSPSTSDQPLPNDIFCGRSIGNDTEEFISVDVQPYLSSDVSENGSTIKNYTSFWSRPEMWRSSDGGPELYEVTNIESVKHFRALPFDEVAMYEDIWPGTEVGIATGIIYPNDKRNIYISTEAIFSSQPTGCAGIDWVGFTTTYRGDLVHDNDGGKTATNTVIIPRNTRIDSVSSSVIGLNKDHTYVGIGSTVIQFKIRRIGPSKINREYGYYFRHYDFEDSENSYDLSVPGDQCQSGYWQGEGPYDTTEEQYHLKNRFLSEYSYAYYYGKLPDGDYKQVYDSTDDATLDINGNFRYVKSYNTTGRWGIYIDDEVKNYFEGRVFIGHNKGIGTGSEVATTGPRNGLPIQPDPILSVFNNKWKNQQDEIDAGSNANCGSTKVTDPTDPMQYQIGMYVEDMVGIGTRVDMRYQLNVDTSNNPVSEKAVRAVGDIDVNGDLTADNLNGNLKVTTSNSNSNFKIPFANTTASTTGNYGLLQDSTATFTYNPSTNTVTATTFNGNLSGDASTVGGVSSGSFLRSDANDSASGDITFNGVVNIRSALDLADNDILRLGSGDDAELFCNGSHLYLDLNSGIGNFYIRDGTTTRFTFDDAGSFTATSNITAYSDITLKKDIEVIPNALDKVMELRGVTFKRIDLDNEKFTGVIAQEVEKVLPEVVMTDDDGIKSVAYGNMVGLLIEAIKELKEEVNDLRSQLNKE